jgi:hypothetical protein
METLRYVLESEMEEILEWIEQMDELGHISIDRLSWKQYKIEREYDYRHTVTKFDAEESMIFESWEECFQYVKETIIEEFTIKFKNK